jgi:hypothetical protein
MKKVLLFKQKLRFCAVMVLGMLCSLSGYAQVSGYTFSSTVGTFTPISGGTTVGNTSSSQEQFSGDPITPIFSSTNLAGNFFVSGSTGFPIGFNFNLGGLTLDRFNISTEGNIKLGSSTDPYSSLQSGNSLPGQFATDVISNTIYALQQNLMGQAGSSMKYITTGSAGSRVLTVEWLGFSRSAVVGDNLNFQIKLYETTNVVEIVYGSFTTLVGTNQQATVGIHGRLTGGVPAGPDFRKVGNTLTGVTMDAAVVATTNLVSPFTNERVQWRNGFLPTSGRTYTFTPAGVTCNFPVIPTASIAPGSNQCVMSWGAAAGATSYNVEYKLTSSGTWLPAPGGTAMAGTTITVTGLAPASSYDFRVQSNCNGTEWITMTRVNPGPGELCSIAIPYGAVAANAGACTPTLVTAGLGNEGSATIGCSTVGVLTDVWYSFVAPSNGKKLIIETTPAPSSNEDWAMQIYSSCGGAVVGCFDDFSGSDFRPYGELCQFDYTGGQTYYIRLMQMQFYGSGPTINLCVYEDNACPVVPANNICANAATYTLQPFGSCPGADVNYTTENATPTIDFTLAAPSCNAVQSSNDVWVKFNTGLNTAVQFRYTLVDATSVGAQIYSGTCGTGTLAPVGGTCYTTPGTRAVTGLTPNTDYYIRFWSPQFNTSPTAGNFTVCIQEAPDCPGGLGTGFVNIGTISGTYSSGLRTTCGQVDDITSSLVNAACGNNGYFTGEDEVFQFQVPSTGLYQVVLSSNSSWVGIKIYSNCPFLGRGGACVASVGSSLANKNLSNINLTAGVDYYMIIDQFAPPSCINQYSFDIQPNPAPPVNDNCGVSATVLTQGVTCNYTTFSYSAGATPSSELGACAANDDDLWYQFVAATSDPQITISPSAGFYPVVEIFTACGTTGICCSFNSNGAGLPVNLSSPTPLTPGVTYYIRVYDAFSGSPLTDDYDICVTNGASNPSCLVIPGTAIIETETCGASTNSSPAFQAISNGQTVAGKGFADCGLRDFDYFRVTTTQAGYMTFTVNSEFPAIVRLMNDNAGTAGTAITTTSTTGFCGGNISVSNPGILPAGNYWAYVLPNQFEDIGCGSNRNDYLITYNFTTTPPAPAVNDNCANAITLVPCGPSLNGSTLSATQSQAAAVCNGDQSNYAEDLWYKFTAVAGLQTLTAISSTMDVVMEVHGYCGGPTLACADAVGANATETINLTTTPGVTYLVRVFAYSVNDPIPGNITISVTTPGGWSGTVSNDWNVAGNWCSGSVPGIGTNVLIPNITPSPVLQTAGNCSNLTLLTGATITTAPATLNVRGNVLAQGSNVLSGSQPLTLSGTSGQAVSGSLEFNNVRISNTTLGGITVSNGADVKVNGVLTLDASAKLNNTGTGALTIVSNATTEGSIAALGAAAQLNGNYTVQRYIPNAGSGWHFIGTPVSGNNYSQWTDDVQISASTGLGNGVIAVAEAERSNIFQYVESQHNVKIDTVQKDGWRVPTSANIGVGRGYRMYVKPAFFVGNPSRIIDNTGTITTGLGAGYSFPTLNRNEYTPCFPSTPTFNPTVCNESNRGWNLLANPFPSNINWDAAGWNKPASMNNAFYTWNGTGAGYQVYVGAGGVSLGVNASSNTNPNMIAKGQGFFVGLRTAGTYTATLTATEAVKSATSAQFVRTASVDSKLKVRISRIAPAMDYSFDANVQFMSGASEGFDMHIDASLMRGANASVGFKAGNEDLIQSTLPSLDGATRVVDLRTFYAGQTGTFKLSFPDIAEFPSNTHVYLKDNVLNGLYDIASMQEVGFNVSSTNNLNSNDRFQLVFSPVVLTTINPSVNGDAIFSVYPNPSNGSKVVASMIGFDEEKVVVTVVDMLGKVVYTSEQVISADRNAEHAIKANLSSGVYNISCVGAKHKFTTKLVVE